MHTGAKRGRGDVAGDAAEDSLMFHLRQCVHRLLERNSREVMTCFDDVFCQYALWFAPRNTKVAQQFVGTSLRAQSIPLVALLSRPISHDEYTALHRQLAELSEAANDSSLKFNGTCAKGLDKFWEQCLRFVDALEAARQQAERSGVSDELEDDVFAALHAAGTNLAMLSSELKAAARSEVPGVDIDFFRAAAVASDLILARNSLDSFDSEFRLLQPPPPYLPPLLMPANTPEANPTLEDVDAARQRVGEVLDEDQEVCMDELATYAIDKGLPAWTQVAGIQPRKPDRFAKVLTGFHWTKFNKARYGSASGTSDLPPKTALAYKFILLYPDLLTMKKGPRTGMLPEPTFHVDTPKEGEETTTIVFSAGAPYLDVAYRIPSKLWDHRPNGVRSSFDPATGRFELYFRFAQNFYKK